MIPVNVKMAFMKLKMNKKIVQSVIIDVRPVKIQLRIVLLVQMALKWIMDNVSVHLDKRPLKTPIINGLVSHVIIHVKNVQELDKTNVQ